MTSPSISLASMPQRMAAPVARLIRTLPTRQRMSSLLSRLGMWIDTKKNTRTSPRRLQVSERVSLAEKSTLSVVQVDGRRFLIASATSTVSLLTELAPAENPAGNFSAVLRESEVTVAPRPRKPRKTRAAKETTAA